MQSNLSEFKRGEKHARSAAVGPGAAVSDKAAASELLFSALSENMNEISQRDISLLWTLLWLIPRYGFFLSREIH